MWGYSPALDMLAEQKRLLTNNCTDEPDERKFSVLLIGNCDGRHIFKTLSQLRHHGADNTAITFYVIEKSLEPVARQILLLTLALEPSNVIGLQEKAILFLEVFGNTVLRSTSYNYVTQKAHQLIHMITDVDFMAKRMPIINVDHLKYKERDVLETIFKFWISSKSNHLNTEILWDNRLRASLTDRYDSKMGVFDWDYHMKLCKIGQESISLAEYKKWRMKGIAYSWQDRVLSQSNCTLISGIQKVNGEVLSFGYTGDIENGPFAPYGLGSPCVDSKFKRQNPRKATNTSLRAVVKILNGITRATECDDLPNDDELEGAVLADDLHENLCSMINETEDHCTNRSKDRKILERENYTAVPMDSVKVIFLPMSYQSEIHLKDKFKNIFDVIVISHNSVESLNLDLMETAKCNSLIIVETLNFALPPKKGSLQSFEEKIEKLANECNCSPIEPLGETDFYRRFEYKG
ncbi:dynein axonemal assembly factor 3 [Hetaerina americana]|uniref:dynein axonemal assembly factor 3 n=1 Tax=Hetaerina americana TaxID=62018 RepID=UPI003A7F5CC8